MSDAQHPRHAQCGPEGLLRQIRGTAARLGVPLAGENALRIFLPSGGIDATALDRIVANTRAWTLGGGGVGGTAGAGGPSSALPEVAAAPPMRACSSWPCAPMREQQLVQQQYGYPGLYASGGGSGAGGGALPPAYGGAYAQFGGGGGGGLGCGPTARAYSEFGYVVHGLGANAAHAALHAGPALEGTPPAAAAAPPPCPPPPPPRAGSGGGAAAVAAAPAAALAAGGEPEVVLPAMRAFTFLRLGPEILDHQGAWLTFMFKMANGG
jgi:hypothetical protein